MGFPFCLYSMLHLVFMRHDMLGRLFTGGRRGFVLGSESAILDFPVCLEGERGEFFFSMQDPVSISIYSLLITYYQLLITLPFLWLCFLF